MMRFFCTLLLISANTVFGQSYFKGLSLKNYKITVNYPGHTVIAFTSPVKGAVSPHNDKFYFWYAANRISSTQGGYSGKLLNGLYSDYYLNKNLKEQGEFKKGLKAGVWKAWFENGVLKETVTWRAGRKNGSFFQYDTMGKVVKKGKYHADLLNGRVITYSGKDSVSLVHYRRGEVYKPKRIKVAHLLKKLKPVKMGKKKDKAAQKKDS